MHFLPFFGFGCLLHFFGYHQPDREREVRAVSLHCAPSYNMRFNLIVANSEKYRVPAFSGQTPHKASETKPRSFFFLCFVIIFNT